MTDRDGAAARLRDVVFSYARGATLPDADELTGEADPDDREGPVLRGVDLDVPAGSFTVVMGASGGGKSTLLRTFNAIIPDFIDGSFRGEVDVLGADATDTRVSEMARDVGMVLQDYESQLFGTSVEAEVAFGPENLAVEPGEIGPRIDDALDLVGLSELGRRREPSGLSGGQKQRLVFAGVAATHPELLVLDEPTSDLDPKGTREIVDLVGTLSERERDVGWSGPETIAMVTHKIEEALLADHAVLLKDGQPYRDGTVREVFTDTDALEAARVAAPPLVEAFDTLGWPNADLPLRPAEAIERVEASDATYESPGSGAPGGTATDLGDPLFELSAVEFAYETDRGPVTAVDGVDLTVREGEVVALVGHNGSGKTTLAKHFNGLHEADSGEVLFRGRPVPDHSMGEIGREVGYVFQNPDHQLCAETVREEVAFGPENFGLEGEELDARVDRALETVELDGLDDEDPFSFSKGQRQRVALAGILATDPEVIVFDEPTTGLDATQQRRFMDLVAKLNREEGVTVVMVTHDMATVARYAPRTVVMRDGVVAEDLSTRALFGDEAALAEYDLVPPHPAEVANAVRGEEPTALTAEELVTALGGEDALSEAEPVGTGGATAEVNDE